MVENQIFNLYKRNNSVKQFLENNFYTIKKFTFPSFHTQDIIYKNSKSLKLAERGIRTHDTQRVYTLSKRAL